MSQWKLRGYVQDSDEEEDDLEATLADLSTTSPPTIEKRVAVTPSNDTPTEDAKFGPTTNSSSSGQRVGNVGLTSQDGYGSQDVASAPVTKDLAQTQATPVVESTHRSESPDPLLGSPDWRPRKVNDAVSSQILGATVHSSPPKVLNHVNLELLASSSDSELSEPPSDSELEVVFASPQRRTDVQVVIPNHGPIATDAQSRRISRSFRPRKPIQLHPYLIDGEKHRREWQGMGMKPVARPKSPVRRTAQTEIESQEQEFDPGQSSPANSTQDISWTTPARQDQRHEIRHLESLNSVSSSTRRKARKSKLPTNRVDSRDHTAHKRRKINGASGSLSSSIRRAARLDEIPVESSERSQISGMDDIWSVPQSPPYSSSPPLIGSAFAIRKTTASLTAATLPDPPTPSNSSGNIHQPMLDLDLLPDSDSDSGPVLRPTGSRPRTISIHSDKSASESNSDESEPENSENDTRVRQIRRRIKGVLPASWLRIDQQAQEKHKTRDRGRRTASASPERAQPQRGVARAVVRREKDSVAQRSRTEESIMILDDTDDEPPAPMLAHVENMSNTVQEASDVAASFDRRYMEDNDSEDMENDHLDLFHLGGASKTGSTKNRKRQSKLTDAFTKLKKPRFSDERRKIPKLPGTSRNNVARKRKPQSRSKTASALSIVDADHSPMQSDRKVPLFIRLALRRARQRPDQGRQSPTNKHIRLHTSTDTDDAVATLQQWKEGALKPKVSASGSNPQRSTRRPLTDRIVNQRHASDVMTDDGLSVMMSHGDRVTHNQSTALEKTAFPGQQEKNHGTTSHMTKSSAIAAMQSTKVIHSKSIRRRPMTYRTAQLEGLESQFGRDHRKIAFERGLQQADRSFAPLAWGSSMKPQLARFLADEDSVPSAPYSPSANKGHGQKSEGLQQQRKKKALRKPKAQRIDIETRQYRQPSEPLVEELIHPTQAEELKGTDTGILQGLGPFGTRYATTFDVTPLHVGTFFGSATFVGSEEFRQTLEANGRDIDVPAGQHHLKTGLRSIECGIWNDETYANISAVLASIGLPFGHSGLSDADHITGVDLTELSSMLRSLVHYFSAHLSFSDPIDRQDFAIKMKQFSEASLSMIRPIYDHSMAEVSTSERTKPCIRTLSYMSVLLMQVRSIAHHAVVETTVVAQLTDLLISTSKLIVKYLVGPGLPLISAFLEQNKSYHIRENGIQEHDFIAESIVVCMHVLEAASIQGSTFWDLVSLELAPKTNKAVHVKTFESTWASAFALLPFIEFDNSGILLVNRRTSFSSDNWAFVKCLLKTLLDLYPASVRHNRASLNEYIRATLTRCHVLIDFWHWKRCDTILYILFDFYGKNELKSLRREDDKGSPRFLEHLSEQPALRVEANDSAFHIFLKCVALGLFGMSALYQEKRIRSIVFRCTPNHGRSHPKDQPLDPENLTALRNHHDLLSTLYWASPPACRPPLTLIKGLVQHENSHREACRLSVKTWANLAAFQLSTNERYETLQKMAEWHQEIVVQTLGQYKQAKVEAEEYLKISKIDGSSEISAHMVRTTINRNQEQVIATLRDCVSGILKAVQSHSAHPSMKDFLLDSGIFKILEAKDLSDSRLRLVIQEVFAVFREYTSLQQTLPEGSEGDSQNNSEDSQEFGSYPSVVELELLEQTDTGLACAKSEERFDFVLVPLWRLLSNAFGAEPALEDNFLTDCVQTWVLIASIQVSFGGRTWHDFVQHGRQWSWQSLPDTPQKRKFTPYFMASLVESDPSSYEHLFEEFNITMLSCLADRDSVLRFQHRLLEAIFQHDRSHPFLHNLPFCHDERTRKLDITLETLRTRRLALISMILANMRNHLHTIQLSDSDQAMKIRNDYSAMLNAFMDGMKSNYQQLRQGSIPKGAYVELVQSIVQLLKQYATDICPVNAFFTDPAAFPLPATDPTYLIGRLRGYAPKLANLGVAKQLSTFVQTVAQRAALDNQQSYLVAQLSTALADTSSYSADKSALRNTFLQGIFPAYITSAFSSPVGLVMAQPIMRALKTILEAMFFDLNISSAQSTHAVGSNILAISNAFIRSVETLSIDIISLRKPYVLQALKLGLAAMTSVLKTLEYIVSRTDNRHRQPPLVTYISELTASLSQNLQSELPTRSDLKETLLPTIEEYKDLLSFNMKSVRGCITKEWTEEGGKIFFGQGRSKKEIVVDIGSMEEEKSEVIKAIDTWHTTVQWLFGENEYRPVRTAGRSLGGLMV